MLILMALLGVSFWNSVRALSALSIVLWVLTGVLAVAVAILLRSQWGQSRPLHRYALLSLLAHLLLACIATSIQLITGPLGSGEGPPVRVRLLAASEVEALPVVKLEPTEPSAEEAIPRPEPAVAVELPKIEPPELAPERAEPEPAVDSSPPPLLASSPVDPTPPLEVADPSIQSTAPVVAQAAPLPPLSAVPEVTPQLVSNARPTAAETPAAAKVYADRRNANRMQIVQAQGGSFATEQAVSAALDWLAYAQSRDGRWDANRWDAGRENRVLMQDRGSAGRGADTAVTALALLAYLGAGHSHMEGSYKETVDDGIGFLLRSQSDRGNLMGDSTFFAQTYSHSMATFALAEAMALTGDQRLKPAVERAVNHLLSLQNRTTGGWRYNAGDRGDLSQLGWVVLALRSAELGGVKVPQHSWDGIGMFLRSVQVGRAGGRAAYQHGGLPSPTMTAEALYCKQVLGQDFTSPTAKAALAESLADIRQELPGTARANLYYWYYGSLALHHVRLANLDASSTWDDWNDGMKRELLALQVTDGDNAGSWSPSACIWGGYGGRVYSTAMGAMCLEVYYRYAPNPDATDPWVAARPGPDHR